MVLDLIFDTSLHKTIWVFWIAALIAVPWVGKWVGIRVSAMRATEVGFILLMLTVLLFLFFPTLIDMLEGLQSSPIGQLCVMYYRQEFWSLFQTK